LQFYGVREKELFMPRKVADCRDFPSESRCTLTISGEEEEVVEAATLHAISVHGHQDTPELRDEIRQSLKNEQASEQQKSVA
jgi:hypothetical protein